MPPLIDPLADLKAEIAAEAAKNGQQPAPEDGGDEADLEASSDEGGDGDAEGEEDKAPEGAEAKDGEGKADAPKDKKAVKAKDKDDNAVVPRSRYNEEAAKRRVAENTIKDLEARLSKLENPPKPGEEGKPKPLTIEEIRAQERANVRLEMQLEDFVNTGNKKYTQEAFDASCNRISEVIGKGKPNNLVAIAIEATGTPALAAKAIYLLGQADVPEIEAFVGMSALKQAAHLARLAAPRSSSKGKQDDDEDDPKPRKMAKIDQDDEPPPPLRPIKGNGRIPEGLGDDVPEDVWFDRFEKQIMNKGMRH